jgi:hypothetical protein
MRRINRFFKSVLAKILFIMVNWLNKKPSKKIIGAFNTKYPNVTFNTWQQIDKYIWEASFILKKNEYKVLFNIDGTWLQTKSYLPFYCLPKTTKDYFKSHYNFENLQKVSFIEKPDTSSFNFEMNSGSYTYKVSIDTSGSLINKKVS